MRERTTTAGPMKENMSGNVEKRREEPMTRKEEPMRENMREKRG